MSKRDEFITQLTRLRSAHANYEAMVASNPLPGAVAQVGGLVKIIAETLEAVIELEIGRSAP